MRSAAMLACLCVACGRFSFDPSSDASSDALVDAPPTGEGVFAIAAHVNSSCAILDGALSCWGTNLHGQLATGDTTDRFAPTPIGTDRDWIAIAPGENHICGIRAGGDVYCWGGNAKGELGQNDTVERHAPTRISLSRPALRIDAYLHTCVILDNDELWCWGGNNEGELGQGDPANSPDIPRPTHVAPGTAWSRVATGQGHTLGVRVGGGVFGTGRNTESELGQGPQASVQYRVMTPIDASGFTLVAGAQDASCALRADNTIVCWGDNSNGELGTGDTTQRDLPTPINSGQAYRTVDIDTFHSCALSPANTIACAGRNVEGQLGLGDTAPRMTLTQSGFTDWIAVSVGRFHTCAMRADRSVWCVGQNNSGQLGFAGVGNHQNWTRTL